MRLTRAVFNIALILWFFVWTSPVAGAVTADRACGVAARAATVARDLPPGMLDAIGVVESGRSASDPSVGDRGDPLRVRRHAWPFTVDADGIGHWFANAADAARFVRVSLADGARAVDVGCFQIDLEDHPGAFASLRDAFDPVTNAGYAAGFLVRLHRRLGSWPAAIAAYHSADPSRGGPYAALVRAAWRGDAGGARGATGGRPVEDRHVIVLGPVGRGLPRIVTP